MAFVDEAHPNLAAHLGFSSANQGPGRDRLDRPIGCLRRKSKQSNLVRILDLAQVAQHDAGRLEMPARQRHLQLEDVHCPEAIGQADRLPGGVTRGQLGPGEQVGDACGRILGFVERDDLRGSRAGKRRGRGLLRLEGRNHEPDRALVRDDQQREAFHGLADEPGQVPQVRPDADEQHRESVGRDGLAARRQAHHIPIGENLATDLAHGRRVARGGLERLPAGLHDTAAQSACRSGSPADSSPATGRPGPRRVAPSIPWRDPGSCSS